MSGPESVRRVGTEWFGTVEARNAWVAAAHEDGWDVDQMDATALGGFSGTVSQYFAPQLASWAEGATNGAVVVDPGAAFTMDVLAGMIAELFAWRNADVAERELRHKAAEMRAKTADVGAKRVGLLQGSLPSGSADRERLRTERREKRQRLGDLLGDDTAEALTHPGRAFLRTPPEAARPVGGEATTPWSRPYPGPEEHGVKRP